MVIKNRELQDAQRELSDKFFELEAALERVRQLEAYPDLHALQEDS